MQLVGLIVVGELDGGGQFGLIHCGSAVDRWVVRRLMNRQIAGIGYQLSRRMVMMAIEGSVDHIEVLLIVQIRVHDGRLTVGRRLSERMIVLQKVGLTVKRLMTTLGDRQIIDRGLIVEGVRVEIGFAARLVVIHL